MSKQWHDEDIEQLLQQMPPVEDTRSKEDVFAKLQAAGAFEAQEAPIVSKRKKRRTPYYIVAAAVACLAIVPLALSPNETTETMQDNEMQFEMATEQKEENDQSVADHATRSMTAFVEQERFAVYETEQMAYTLIYAVRDDIEEVIVPVTYLQQQQVQESVNVLSNDAAVQEMGATLTPPFTNVQYALYETDGSSYYAVNEEVFATAAEAIQQLRTVQPPLRTPVLPNITYQVEETEALVTVTFESPLQLEQYAIDDALRMLEAFNLTATSYGKQLSLQNVEPAVWQSFDFSAPLPAAIGANRLYLE